MVALTGGDLTGTSARIRARHADGSWGQWYETETLTGHGRNNGTARHRPRLRRQDHDGPDLGQPPGRRTPHVGAEDQAAQPTWVTSRRPRNSHWRRTSRPILITPPQAPADTQWNPPTAAIGAGQAPNIISRAQWGADEAVHCGNRPFDQPIRAAVVHHTAESNDYQPQDSVAIMRSISRITPRSWAGATSPTTPSSTSTARYSRAGPAH